MTFDTDRHIYRVTTYSRHMTKQALSDVDYQALADFRHALRIFLRFSEDEARRAGVTPNQHQLLLAVRGHRGDRAPAAAELAERLQLRVHSVVELIDRAEAAGLIRRTTDPVDGRRQLVHLTPRGTRTLASLTAAHRDELRRFRKEMFDVLDELG
jgi:DNA-binding MarR family transcriptional regulator